MKFKNLKSQATSFLDSYKSKNPASYAAAQQAIGGLLIVDGLIGIDNPVGNGKRSGIFGTFIGMLIGLLLLIGSGFLGSAFGTKYLTAETNATVVSVSQSSSSSTNNNQNSGSGSCNAVAQYSVDGKQYSTQSSYGSSSLCSLSQGESINIKYNPEKPDAWGYDVDTINKVFSFLPWIGLIIFLISGFTFVIRLLSIIYGWKLLKSGRKLAKTLPEGTELNSMVDEVKKTFSSGIFNGSASATSPAASKLPSKSDS